MPEAPNSFSGNSGPKWREALLGSLRAACCMAPPQADGAPGGAAFQQAPAVKADSSACITSAQLQGHKLSGSCDVDAVSPDKHQRTSDDDLLTIGTASSSPQQVRESLCRGVAYSTTLKHWHGWISAVPAIIFEASIAPR